MLLCTRSVIDYFPLSACPIIIRYLLDYVFNWSTQVWSFLPKWHWLWRRLHKVAVCFRRPAIGASITYITSTVYHKHHHIDWMCFFIYPFRVSLMMPHRTPSCLVQTNVEVYTKYISSSAIETHWQACMRRNTPGSLTLIWVTISLTTTLISTLLVSINKRTTFGLSLSW